MGDSGDVVGVQVDPLHSTGGNVAGRSEPGGAAARGLRDGLDGASTGVGHPIVKGAMTTFVTNGVIDPANKLGGQLTAAGNNVSNVAATARNSDEEGGRSVRATVSDAVADETGLRGRINGV